MTTKERRIEAVIEEAQEEATSRAVREGRNFVLPQEKTRILAEWLVRAQDLVEQANTNTEQAIDIIERRKRL